MSLLRAFNGEMYRTRTPFLLAEGGPSMRRLTDHRKAANVFPVPVEEWIKT